jgi:AcrR family transcriptional regulator
MEYNDKQIKIIESSEKLFAKHGFDATSIRQIADEAEINIAMISYYFGNKEKLLEAIFTYRVIDSSQRLEAMLNNKSLTSFQRIEQLIDYYIERFFKQSDFYKIMMREQVNNRRENTHQLILNFKIKLQEILKKFIQDGQKEGSFKKNIDLPMMMNTMIGTISHTVATQDYYKVINHLEDLSEEQFQKTIKKKLQTQLKFIFKAILIHEA